MYPSLPGKQRMCFKATFEGAFELVQPLLRCSLRMQPSKDTASELGRSFKQDNEQNTKRCDLINE